MSNPHFNVILKGVLPDFDIAQAQADFAVLFSLATEESVNLFLSENPVLKTNISRDVADKYINRLATIGVSAIAESGTSESLLEKNDLSEGETVDDSMCVETAEPVTDDSSATIVNGLTSSITTQQTTQQMQAYSFSFTGNGTEYFKIWIVNILLSIVTLGVYSAWAKVRNKQYFYGNTHIADYTFEYTADPVQILKGRAIAFVLYVGLAFANYISPMVSVVATIVFLLFLPFIIVNSLKFNARYSSYRNIAFRFTGTLWGAVKAFLLWPLAGIFTMGILFPYALKRQAQYITNNHFYGSEPFHFNVHVKEYFFMMMILVAISMLFFMVLVAVVTGASVVSVFADYSLDSNSMLMIVPIILGYMAFYVAVGAYAAVTMTNIHWNNTTLKTQQFTANWKIPSYMSLLATNTLGILLTLGLFIPFAKVRTATYKANHMALLVDGNLDSFIANELDQSNSLAEGVHDIFDIDISI